MTAGLLGKDAAAQNGNAFYYYNGQRIPLIPLAGQVLVQHAPTVSAASASRTASQFLAVPESSVSATGVPGWSRVNVATSSNAAFKAATSATVPMSVASIAGKPGVAFASPIFTSASGGMISPTPNILIRYRAGQNPVTAFAAIRTPAMLSQAQIGESGIWNITTNLRDGFAVLALANQLQTSAVLEYATPDFIQTVERLFVPSDPRFRDCWGLRNTAQRYTGRFDEYPFYGFSINGTSGFDVKAVEAWGVTRGSGSVIVLVMDDGVQLNHPDLDVVAGRDFTGQGGGGGPLSADDNHGTLVAGCIAAKANGVGSVGIAPGVRIATAKITTIADGSWTNFRDSNVVSALEWGRSVGARISNSSWGSYLPNTVIDDAFRRAKAAGMVHFAAAGNHNIGKIMFPAASPHVNAVGAALPNGKRVNKTDWWWGSNYGTGLEFMAPGEVMVSTDRTGSAGEHGGDHGWFNGTSAASPYAAGIAALLLSREPSLTPDQVTERMIASCRDMAAAGYDTETGHGFLDAFRTLVPNDSAQPEIRIRGSAIEITNNDNTPSASDHTSFGTVKARGGAIDRVFTIDNLGNGDLRLVGSPTVIITGSGASHFAVEALPATTIAATRSSSFTVRFRPNGKGVFNATVSLANTDADENPTIFAIAGSASWDESPEIRLSGNGTEITNGDATPSTADHSAFGQVNAAGGFIDRVFTIENPGTGELRLTGSPAVVISGPGAGQFSIQALPAATISAARSTTFALRFRPAGSGSFDAAVSIANTDPDEDPTTFAIRGSANIPSGDDLPNGHPGRTVNRISNTAATLNHQGDVDVVTFVMPWSRKVVMETLGSTDTAGALLDASGRVLASDSNSGAGSNFRIEQVLGAGTYHLRIQGQSSSTTGDYVISLH